jgi:hypothetical protein
MPRFKGGGDANQQSKNTSKTHYEKSIHYFQKKVYIRILSENWLKSNDKLEALRRESPSSETQTRIPV